jgi:outer membrane lipopolysaccharide assembly protein LptE/RlpB
MFILLFFGLSLLSGCGYHLTTDKDPSLIAGKTIAIPVWRSKVYRPFMETVLTDSLLKEFSIRSGGQVVGVEAADLVLTGTIKSYGTSAVSFSADDQVREYRATISVDSTLTEKRSQTVLWKGELSSSQDYPASIDITAPNRIALQQNSEEAAIKEICRKLAEQIYLKVTESF